MEDQPNLLGATIFWLYIVLALIFTFFAIESILKSSNPARHKHVATFSIIAAISFSTLSFNMLHVLIDSYSTWSERQVVPLALSPSSVWQWSITSTLFRNFGEAIVLDDARFLWTQSALMATMSVSFFMGIEGTLSVVCATRMFIDQFIRSAQPGTASMGLLCSISNSAHFIRAEPVLHRSAALAEQAEASRGHVAQLNAGSLDNVQHVLACCALHCGRTISHAYDTCSQDAPVGSTVLT